MSMVFHRGFTTVLVLVAGVMAAAVYTSGQALKHGGVLLTALAATAVLAGVLGFIVLARAVVVVERQRRAQ